MHGVRPEISAVAGSGDEIRIDESAKAAENAFRFEFEFEFDS